MLAKPVLLFRMNNLALLSSRCPVRGIPSSFRRRAAATDADGGLHCGAPGCLLSGAIGVEGLGSEAREEQHRDGE
jgi:hypothetical protein